MEVAANHLDWLALAIGAVGSFLWAHNGESAKHASLWWLVSSLLWIAFAWLHGMPALGVRDVLGIATAAYGCYRWRQPRGAAATNRSAQQPASPSASWPRSFASRKR